MANCVLSGDQAVSYIWPSPSSIVSRLPPAMLAMTMPPSPTPATRLLSSDHIGLPPTRALPVITAGDGLPFSRLRLPSAASTTILLPTFTPLGTPGGFSNSSCWTAIIVPSGDHAITLLFTPSSVGNGQAFASVAASRMQTAGGPSQVAGVMYATRRSDVSVAVDRPGSASSANRGYSQGKRLHSSASRQSFIVLTHRKEKG